MKLSRKAQIIGCCFLGALTGPLVNVRAEPHRGAKPVQIPGWRSAAEFEIVTDGRQSGQVNRRSVESYVKKVKAAVGKCWYRRIQDEWPAISRGKVAVVFAISEGGRLNLRSVTAQRGANKEAVAAASYAIKHATVIEPTREVAAWIRKERREIRLDFEFSGNTY